MAKTVSDCREVVRLQDNIDLLTKTKMIPNCPEGVRRQLELVIDEIAKVQSKLLKK